MIAMRPSLRGDAAIDDDAGFMTGAGLVVDGGITAQ